MKMNAQVRLMMKFPTSVFHKNRWRLTILCLVLTLFLSPLMGLTLFLPHLPTAVPVLLLVMLGYVGPASMTGAVLVLGMVCGVLFGLFDLSAAGILGFMIFVIPYLSTSVILVEKKKEFWISSGISAFVMFISSCIIISMIGTLSGTDAVSAITDGMKNAIDSVDGLGQMLATKLVEAGLVTLSDSTGSLPSLLSAEQSASILNQILALQDTMMRLQIPAQISTGAIAAGVLGQFALRKGIRKFGTETECPALRTWRVPKGWGRVLGGTLLILFVLARLLPTYSSSMFYVFSGIFDLVFTLQGIAAICWITDKKWKKAFLQKIIFIAGFFLLPTPAVVFGIADQSFDFTHRREQLGEEDYNPFDPRAGKNNG